MDFLKNFFSIEERRVSALLIFTGVSLIFTFIIIWVRKDIPSGLKDIVETLIWSVVGAGGVTAIDNAVGYIGKVKELKIAQDTFEDNNNQPM